MPSLFSTAFFAIFLAFAAIAFVAAAIVSFAIFLNVGMPLNDLLHVLLLYIVLAAIFYGVYKIL